MINQVLDHFNTQNHKLNQFRIRLLARLFIIFVLLTQGLQRYFFNYKAFQAFSFSRALLFLDFACLFVLIVLLIVERILYMRIGAAILKYTRIIDALFFIFYVIEWMAGYYAVLDKLIDAKKPLTIWDVFGPTSIVWRTLLQGFIVRRWYLKSIAPLATIWLFTGFTLYVHPVSIAQIIIRGVSQTVYLLVFFYFEDKVNFQLLISNIQQGKWFEINQFILDNIPENIAILDWTGEFKYKNNYFQQFLKNFSGNNNEQRFLKQLRGLQKCGEVETINSQSSSETAYSDRQTFVDTTCQTSTTNATSYDRIDSLEMLIKKFKDIVESLRLQERSFLAFSGKLYYGDDKERSVEVKISFIMQNRTPYVILILRDTTHRDLLITLESNNKYKDYLLASVSHELRAPLNATINFLETAIQSDQISSSVRDSFLDPALRSSKLLLHLINDILDTSQITAQKLRLIFLSASLQETIMNSIKLVELQAKKKGIDLQTVFDPWLPISFCTDHVRLSQIVLNLMNNALKFTQQGFIRVRAVPIEDTNCVKINVEDSGMGMKKEDLAKLFQSFTHIEFQDRSNINPSGVGLGLSIAKSLAEMLGPKDNKGVMVESTLGQGSKFSFVLENKETGYKGHKRGSSTARDESWQGSDDIVMEFEPTLDMVAFNLHSTRSLKRPATQGTHFTFNSCSCPKILLVDDDLFNILAYETILGTMHLTCDAAFNGKLAIDKILSRVRFPCGQGCKCYSVVFMDQEMPEMNGIEAVREIRRLQAQKVVPDIKVVGCTGHKGDEEVKKFFESGINQCIEKPVSKDVITSIIEAYSLC